MPAQTPRLLTTRIRWLTRFCLLLWLGATLLPVLLARSTLNLGPWPLDFWLAAQGSVLAYLLIVVLYAVLVNRWEREAGVQDTEPPEDQDT